MSKKLNPLEDDWEDVVKYFDSQDSVYLTKQDRKDRIIRSALEEDVKKKLLSFKTKLNRNTPRHKCEILTNWLEVTVVKTVLERESYSKRKSRLLRNSAELEEEEGVRGAIAFGSKVAKSSLMGQDPFGDQKELPKGCYSQSTATDTTEIDEEVSVSLTAEGENREQDETGSSEQTEEAGAEGAERAEARAEAKAAPKKKAYNADGLMLKRLQTECRELITVAIYFLLDEELTTRLRRREADYRRSETLKEASPRGCMPWKEYKAIILACITQGAGWRELRSTCDLQRKEGSLYMSWLEEINKARDIVVKFGHNLHDGAYMRKEAMSYLVCVC